MARVEFHRFGEEVRDGCTLVVLWKEQDKHALFI